MTPEYNHYITLLAERDALKEKLERAEKVLNAVRRKSNECECKRAKVVSGVLIPPGLPCAVCAAIAEYDEEKG